MTTNNDYNQCRGYSQFESIQWTENNGVNGSETPAITPGNLSYAADMDYNGIPIFSNLTFGVHWNLQSFPAWTGCQQPNNTHNGDTLPSTPSVLMSYVKDCGPNGDEKSPRNGEFLAPFGIDHIAAMTDQIRDTLGFQFDVSINVFELIMSQLDSRASRSCPKAAIRSLHSDYISGPHANFRKWYFASQMDKVDRMEYMKSSFNSSDSKKHSIFDFGHRKNHSENLSAIKRAEYGSEEDEEEITLADAEANWDFRHDTCSDIQRLVDILIYLFCWSESNQVRYMPECLAFIVKCCRDYYHTNFSFYPQNDRAIENLPSNFFLDKIVTPIYNCYRSHNYCCTNTGNWIRREGDHKDFIGYDDMNQLFWYYHGIKSLTVSPPGDHYGFNESYETQTLVELAPKDWYIALANVTWKHAFKKTYRESRSWLHNITNFSRIWILHVTVFWFYTSFNSPSLYTTGYNYMNPEPPKTFVRYTIMSMGGLFGPLLTFIGLIGELRFVPRNFSGAKPISSRLIAVCFLFFLLGIPAICNLLLNPWDSGDVDLMPATVISVVLFMLAILYTIYFSLQPLGSVFGTFKPGWNLQEPEKRDRSFLSNILFTANFAKQHRNDAIISWVMCLMIFTAKFVESYFFLTLSVRDPIRELRIMNLEDRCVDDAFLIAFLCRTYPKIIFVGIILTDLTLFFLDTYLWYVIFNTIISVSFAFKQGTSIWSPWRNIYSRLPHRISTKLLAPSANARPTNTSSFTIRVVWNSIVDSMYRNHILNREQAMRLIYLNVATQEPRFFTMEEDGKALERSSANANAHRRISFFAQSLSTPMQPAAPVHEMPSFTVLIPHFKEKMILKLSETIKADMGAKVTVLEYLQRLYPQEWENFVEELQIQSQKRYDNDEVYYGSNVQNSASPQGLHHHRTTSTNSHQIAIQKLGFSTLDPNDTEKTRLWCSQRAQTLYRTLRGFSNYSEALRVLTCAEDPAYQWSSIGSSDDNMLELLCLCDRKFRLLVAMQLYSQFSDEELFEVETILSSVPELTISYVERDEISDEYYSCLIDRSCPLLESGKRRPRMRVKLSGNPILGDGKSDNQNAALPFYRGEYIQLVDANQDNYLEECLKIRNILMEFEAPSGLKPVSSMITLSKMTSTPCTTPGLTKFQDVEAGNYSSQTILESERAPIAIVGAREYIFSENIGILGDVAAGKEQTFGTLFSRTLARVGAKLHYGHPDFLNAIFMTTRGGISKGQRGLHLNEDIYAGMTALLRGGRIRHCEYFQCGKGRDLGFVSILNFTAKIGAGMGEQMLSREYFYLGTQLPFDRFISFYYAHPGFHLNNVFIMISLEMLLAVILWITSIASVTTPCIFNKDDTLSTPHRPAGCANILPLIDWIQRCVVSIFLVFFVSLCPLFFHELTEKGLFKSIARISRHFASLSMLFEVFVCRIYARSFWEDMNVGGAKYLATGRGFATSRVPFYVLYSGYYPEILCGIKSGAQLWFASYTLWNLSYLWFWLTTFSLCMCPVLYNPHQFAFTEFFYDYQNLIMWFWRASGVPRNSCSWISYSREIREKLTGVKRRTLLAEGSRPPLWNSVIFQVGTATLTFLCFGMPYIYAGTQAYNIQGEDGLSVLLRILLVSLIPIVANFVVVTIFFFISILLCFTGISKHSNIIAMIIHTCSLVFLIISWWVLYILELQQFHMVLLGIATVCSFHLLLRSIITVLLVRRQRSQQKTNDPWWSGDWVSAKLGWKLPLVIAEEFVLKFAIEPLDYAYDFLACHVVLTLQVPFLLLPCIDKVHSLFLMWLRPSVTAAASKTVSLKRKRECMMAARYYSAIFILIDCFLICLILFPMYAPSSWLGLAEEQLLRLAPW